MQLRVLLFLSLLSFTTAHADIIYVNAAAAAGGNGSSWGTAFNDLQDALAVTVSGRGDQVWIAQGTYYPIDINNQAEFDRNATFYIKAQVALYGGFIGSETDLVQRDWEANPTILSGEISGDSSYWSIHVTTIDNNHVTFDGITITKGNANGSYHNTDRAAAVYGSGTVTATNCTFSGNSATEGGGVAYGSTWTATDCTFSGNSARIGGVAYGGTWTATNCTFSGNSAEYGGVAIGSTVTATNCTFSGNSASEDGGVARNGTWSVTNCSFSSNSAPYGGVAHSSTWTATNCTFSGNWGSSYGSVAYYGTWSVTNCSFSSNSASYGGVAHSSTWTATNCTFSGNSATGGGGVAYGSTWTATNCTFSGNWGSSYGSVAYGGTWKIYNNIFHDNPGNGGGQFWSSTIYATNETTPSTFTAFTNNLIQGGSDAFQNCTIPFPIPESNLIDADPLFVNAAAPAGPDEIWGTKDDGLRLQSSSPAIGLGDASYLPLDTYDLDGDDDAAESLPVDIAGYKRIQDTTLDLGAYEYSVFTTTAGAATGGSVSPSGAIVNIQPTEITLTATADNGYAFGYWSGDVPEELELDNPLTLTVEADGAITAVFVQDSSDSDGDGLSNYQEVIIYGTDPDDADSDDDGDGLRDTWEIQYFGNLDQDGSSDYDSDGFDNEAEEAAGTDPADEYSNVFYDLFTFTLNDDGVSYSVTDCDSAASGEMIIPSTYSGLPVTSIGGSAFYNCDSLTSITIPDSVTSIGDSAFYSCNNLTSITIPDSVTSIGDSAFYSCTSLTSITIPDGVTSIGDGAFSNCTSLTSITIPNSVTSIADRTFYNCTSLTSITILDGVTSIGGYAFNNCTSLTSITIPDSVTSIGEYAFQSCTSLTSITIPDSVTSIADRTFYNCTSLTSITILGSVTSIGEGAFDSCSSLTSITIPDSVTSIGWNAFSSCTSLTSITFEGPPPAFDLQTLTETSSEPILYYKTFPEAYRVYKETYNLPLVYLGPPTIRVQPQGAIATSGETVNLSVSATDVQGSALTYQWMRNGVDISGEVSATLTISSIASSDSGSYQVKVTNNEGTTVSEAANVTLVASQLYTQQQYDAALTSGFNLGVQSAQNAQADGLYTEEQLVDLRAGSVLLKPQSNGSAILSLQIERSDDLNTWTSHPDDLVEVNMPMSQDTQFYRFKMGE